MTKKQFYRRCSIASYISLILMLVCVFGIVFSEYKTLAIVTCILAFVMLCITAALALGDYKPEIPARPEPMFTPEMVACVSTLHTYYKYWEIHYFKKTNIAKAYALLCVNRPSEYSAVHLHYKRSIFDIGGRLMYNHIIEMPITDDTTVIIDDNGTLDPSYYHE